MTDKIRVFIIDDSPLFRNIIKDVLEGHPKIEVVGSAENGKIAQIRLRTINPDIITLDIEMPGMNGLDFLKWLMAHKPKPVIMLSALTQKGAKATFQALELGAIDFVPKLSSVSEQTFDEISQLLITKILAAFESRYFKSWEKKRLRDYPKFNEDSLERVNKLRVNSQGIRKISNFGVGAKSNYRFLLMGTSTGGPKSLATIISQIPENFPACVLIVQHMPAGFTKAFAERLNSLSNLDIKEAEDGDLILPGRGFVAPGDWQMKIAKKKDHYYLNLDKSEPVNGHRPSVDILFNSAVPFISNQDNAIGIIMTGMGKDGAEGLKNLKSKGAFCLAQDPETSVVFGMNREAIELGAVDSVVGLDQLLPLAISKL